MITGAACARTGTRPPVVAFAYTRSSAPYLDLAREALREREAPAATWYYDSLSESESPGRALAFAAAIVDHSEIAVVVGPSNSRHALATAPAYNAAGLPQILPSSTSRRLRGAGPGTFVLVPDDSVEGEFLARFAWDSLGARRAVVFFANDEYGEGLRAGISAAFTTLGGKVLDAIPTAEEMDYEAVVGSAVSRYHPDVIFSAERGRETGALLHEARRGSRAVPVVAGDGAYHLPTLVPGHSIGRFMMSRQNAMSCSPGRVTFPALHLPHEKLVALSPTTSGCQPVSVRAPGHADDGLKVSRHLS